MYVLSFFEGVARLQTEYKKMIEKKSFTKMKLCELCVPFRDEYGLTDLQVINIASGKTSVAELLEILKPKLIDADYYE